MDSGRVREGRTVQKTLLYVGEINDSQKAAWVGAIEVVEGREKRQIALFPEDREIPAGVDHARQLRMEKLELCRPREWGSCWLACVLWEMLGLREFWQKRLPSSRKGTRWPHVLQTLGSYRLIDPAPFPRS